MKIKELIKIVETKTLSEITDMYKIVSVSDRIGLFDKDNRNYVFKEFLSNPTKKYSGYKEIHFKVVGDKHIITKIRTMSNSNIRVINL